MDKFQAYFYTLCPKYDDNVNGINEKEKEIAGMHRHYCCELIKAGVLLRMDVNLRERQEMIVFAAESKGAAIALFEADPAVGSGLFHAELRCGEGNVHPGGDDLEFLILKR